MKNTIIILILCLVISNAAFSQEVKGDEVYRKGLNLFSTGKYSEALDDFLKIENNRNFPDLDLNRGLCYYAMNDYTNAEKYFSEGIKKDPNNVVFLLYLARCNKMLGKIKTAITFYDKAVLVNPNDHVTLNEFALLYFDSRNYSKSLSLFLKIKDRNDAYLNHYLGMCCFNLGLLDSSIGYFEKALELNQNLLPSLNSLGRCYYLKKRYDEAILKFTKSLNIEYESPTTHKNLGDCFYKLEKNSEALIEYKYALYSGDSSLNLLSNIAWAYFKIDEYDSTVKYLKIIEENDPNDGKRKTDLAGVLMKMRRYEEAEEKFKTGTSQIENAEVAELSKSYVFYGITLHQEKKYKDAEDKYRRAIELLPSNALAYYNLGVTMEIEKNKKEALKNYEKYLIYARGNFSLDEYTKEANERIKILKNK
jgi:tetratricopeptide (TPR) repeat protein